MSDSDEVMSLSESAATENPSDTSDSGGEMEVVLRTGYKKAHYRHLPVVLTHSTLDKCFYLAQRAVLTGVMKIVTVFCPLRYQMT